VNVNLDLLVQHVLIVSIKEIIIRKFCFKIFLFIFHLVIGCNVGKSLSCMNGGICQVNGVCECEFGYTGSTCESCG
jgi:hypothetical protein